MKVKVTVKNMETGKKDSVIGDGVMAYVTTEDQERILALGKYNSLDAVSGIAYTVVRSASKRHPRGAAGVYDDIINRLKKDAAMDGLNEMGLTLQEMEKRMVDAIRGAFKDEA